MDADAERGPRAARGEPRDGRRARRRRAWCSPRAAAPARRSKDSRRARASRRAARRRARRALVPYEVAGRAERLVYLSAAATWPPTRSCAPASRPRSRTSCGRRSPACSRCSRPRCSPARTSPTSSSRRAREVEQIRELIDDVLFLSELETGRAVVSLSATPVLPVLEEVAAELEEPAARAGRRARASRATRTRARDAAADAAHGRRRTSPRTRSATPARARHSRSPSSATTAASCCALVDDGIGVVEADLPRLFERFYRADRARASRGTGLGLAIVKHVVASAGGTVEARGARGHGLEIRCVFPRAVAVHHPFTSRSPVWHPTAQSAVGTLARMTQDRDDHANCASARLWPSLLAGCGGGGRRRRGGRRDHVGHGIRERRRPLGPDPGRRLEHGRPRSRRRPPSASRTRTPASRSPSASPAPAAASSASAAARPTSRTPRARSRTTRVPPASRRASSTSSSRSRTTRSPSS